MPVISTRATGRILASYRSRVPRSLITPLAAFAVASAWSGSWITGKLGVTGAPPLELSAVRFVIGAIAVAAIAIATRTSIDLGGMGPIALSALFGYVLYNAFVFVGLTMAPASDGALIVPTTIPVLPAVLATLVGERLTPAEGVGFALASCGAALVVAARQRGRGPSGSRLPRGLPILGGGRRRGRFTG